MLLIGGGKTSQSTGQGNHTKNQPIDIMLEYEFETCTVKFGF